MEEIKKFSDNQGLPANDHAKKLAKKKNQDAKKVKPQKIIYTVKDGKLLQITVKPNGAYSTYIGTKKKLGEDQYNLLMKKWREEKSFVSEHELSVVCNEIIYELNK